MPIKVSHIKKILLIRDDRFGEFLLNIPVAITLKKTFPDSKTTIVVRPEVAELARIAPGIDDVWNWDRVKVSRLSEKLRFIAKIRNSKFDLALILNPSKDFHLYTYISGIPNRVGYNRKCGFLLTHRIEDRKFEDLKHEVEYNLELVKTIGVNADTPESGFLIEVKAGMMRERMEGLNIQNKSFIVIHPWASNQEKEWPENNFKNLAAELSSKFGLPIVLIGGGDEITKAALFCEGLNLTNMTGKTTLIELAELLKMSSLLITNDSGPMHLAAAVGTPVVAIFRKTPAGVSAKRWGPIGRLNTVIENDLISEITVGEVLNGINKILKK